MSPNLQVKAFRGALLVSLWLTASSGLAESSFEIPAWAFDRGNAKTFTQAYADAGPVVAYGGQSPVLVEYDIDFPVSGSYKLIIRYAAASERPVSLLIDGKLSASACCKATGSWNSSGANWGDAIDLYIPAGKHTIRLQRSGDFPHLVSLKFSSAEIPQTWVFQRPIPRKMEDPTTPVFEPFIPEVNTAALRLAIQELMSNFGTRYSQGQEFLNLLGLLEQQLQHPAKADETRSELAALRARALLEANPLFDFKDLLLIKRSNTGPDLGLPRNWESDSSLPKEGYDDSICLLNLGSKSNALSCFFKPERDVFVGDVDLNWDADKLLLSMPGTNGHWQVFELGFRPDARSYQPADLRQLTGEQPDVDSYDACYLPDGRIIFTSTACFIGVPCVYGSSHVATLYSMEPDGSHIRQLCFDQEHNWCPTVLNNGRVLYTRWEYADTPHSNTRLLFHMNPDGTEQAEFLGSNSYWPNSMFYARPIPGHPTMIVTVIGGHHDNPRMGELVLLDPARGRQEGSPAVQKIPGYGKPVEPTIRDGLTLDSWPKFLHPYPLSDKFFLVSCKPNADAPWGIYLVDVFDNLVPVHQLAGASLFEPVPFRTTRKPPSLPDRVDPKRQDALVMIQDIYAGDGLRDVPRGTVKSLRLFTYHFAYQNMGGLLGVVGAEGPWDIKRVLGTVPVYADGSAKFLIPANTPISMQPLDGEGKAIQLMRSWMTAMPGEVVQCAGCHERQNTGPMLKPALALSQPPAQIKPWYGPVRGFSYAREVQPVIDRYCVNCHDGQPVGAGAQICDLRGTVMLTNWSSITPGNGGGKAGKFSVGYDSLNRYVRRNGIEGDYHVLEPMEFHADTTDLVQLLKKGHYGVDLDPESWDRLITWIDLNCPYHGTWGENIDNPGRQRERRRDLLKRYANVDDDSEVVISPQAILAATVPSPSSGQRDLLASAKAANRGLPSEFRSAPSQLTNGWPFDVNEARKRQCAAAPKSHRSIDLGGGVSIEMVLIPAGEFVMGSLDGQTDERPLTPCRIDRPFWMAAHETLNSVYAVFNPSHDSGLEDKNTYQFGVRGYPANKPDQPVVRLSWNEAMAFCRWLSDKTGEQFSLPSEAQWEYACRAGVESAFSFGGLDADFSKHANFADAKLSEFASDPYTVDVPLRNPTRFDDWIPKEARCNDGALITVAPGRYEPNAWGLFDMHGNAAEFTRSTYAAYPYNAGDESKKLTNGGSKVVRGGSWRDIPARCTSSFRLSYLPWQRVYNVGFRVVSEGQKSLLARTDRTER